MSQWADQFRYLSKRASAESGLWRTSRTPYLKEIMDCLSVHSSIEKVVLKKGAQTGGTEAGLNWLGYIVDVCPAPTLLVSPTVELAKRSSKQRIDPMIEECPSLRAKISSARSRDSGNTQLMKEFPNGLLVMTGANSSVGLRSLPAQFVFMDEVDAYPGDVDGEGDPVSLAEARARTFSRRKIFLVSTPTVEGNSRIDLAYQASDQRKYHVPCPHCKAMQVLVWEQVKWPKEQPELATYECEQCKQKIEEHHKSFMLENGIWRATQKNENPKVAGFHLSSLYSPLGWFSWKEAAVLWKKSCQKSELVRTFKNTYLGECFRETGDCPDWEKLFNRRESYQINSVPKGVLLITMGVDVQKHSLILEIVGWTENKESYSIDFLSITGDTSTAVPWKKLDEILSSQWKLINGIQIPISMTAIDSGFNTNLVYSYVRTKPMSRVMAVKGMPTTHYALGHPTAVDVTLSGKRVTRGTKVWPVGVNFLKGELYSWLKQESPKKGNPFPTGFCHFPEYDEEYFKQLTAEELTKKMHRGYSKYIWQKVRPDNHALDCRIYARAAAAAVGLDRMTSKDFEKLKVELGLSEGKHKPSQDDQARVVAYEMV